MIGAPLSNELVEEFSVSNFFFDGAKISLGVFDNLRYEVI